MPDQIDLSTMQSVPVKSAGGYTRLHRHWREPTGEMWDDIWKATHSADYWREALQGSLASDYERLFLKYARPGQKLLEAGCGVGQVVLAMRARGFDCQGLDFAEKVIGLLNERFPDVPFHQGDIRSLPFPDNSFDGYISLGVIEHFIDGQEEMLREAGRIVRPGGHIFVSVPALNSFRKWKIKRGGYSRTAALPFFESCISVEELEALLRKTGFEPLEHSYQNTVMTFAQETPIRPLYRRIEDTRYPRSAVDRLLRMILPKSWFGHMVMVVAKRK
jgi:ubiquinone/menaquinone biosynthesis C-methylase UbiE